MNYLEQDYKPLSPRVNFTDPIVRHDPTIGKTPIGKFNMDNKTTGQTGAGRNDIGYDIKKIEAIKIPVIQVNKLSIYRTNIVYMNFNYDSFVPTLYLVIRQDGKGNEYYDVPGIENNITVVMSAYSDGAYKPVSTDFYITDTKYEGDLIKYWATYKHIGLEVPHTEQVTFNPYPTCGCTSKYCQLPTNRYPTTFEFLHYIAVNKLGLGFATTEHVKEIKDDKTRLISNETYYRAILDALREGGLDSDSVFDGWIDLYRYLVVVNVPWVLNQAEAEYNDIGWHIEGGMQAESVTDDDAVKQTPMVHRMITNSHTMRVPTNILIENWEWEVNNRDAYINGTEQQIIIGNPASNGGMNGVSETDMRILENSADGIYEKSQYGFPKQEFLGYEYGDPEEHNTPILLQSKIHDNFFKKYRSKRLKITMSVPNFGLQRGTLINVVIVQTNTMLKYDIARSVSNYDGEGEGEPNELSNYEENTIIEGEAEMPDPALTGMYYIDGMEFLYDEGPQKITQNIFLIKRGYYRSTIGVTNRLKI